MLELQHHLQAVLPGRIPSTELDTWNQIVPLIKTVGLEAALLKHSPSRKLETEIMRATVELLLPREAEVMSQVATGCKMLRFTRLIPHLLKPSSGIPVITTNYDRLIEFATEAAGLGVDTMFSGTACGVFDEKRSYLGFCTGVSQKGSTVKLKFQDRIVLFKPHGSLDWYQRGDKPVRCSIDLPLPRLIITPGLNKFRNGYESPFDRHRDKANAAIDKAARFLILGYGFNDDHLQTHLTPKIRSGVPTLILARRLSQNALEIAQSHNNVIAIQSSEIPTPKAHVITGADEFGFPSSIWDLSQFVSEVLEP